MFHSRNVLDATDAGKTPVSLMTDDDQWKYSIGNSVQDYAFILLIGDTNAGHYNDA